MKIAVIVFSLVVGLEASDFVKIYPLHEQLKLAADSSSELQTVIDKMREADIDLASEGQIQFNFGKQVSESSATDVSPEPLFESVEQKLLENEITAALIAIYDSNLFTPDVCEEEPAMSGFRKSQLWSFLGLITNTTVFAHAFEYLQQKGVATTTVDNFKGKLFNLWFGTYSRCSPTLGSSGFEHVFVGESKSSSVEGLHNWIRYYLLEKAGDINYYGYYHYDPQYAIGTFQYKWKNSLKNKGGFFLGSSPAFDFSVLSICALTAPGANACNFKIGDDYIMVTTYTQSCSVGTCLSTAYPSDI